MYAEAIQALEQCNGNKAAAARLLKIAPTTLKDRLAIIERNGGTIPVITPKKDADTSIASLRKLRSSQPQTHYIIPDVQAKPGVKLDHLRWAGMDIAHRKPDLVLCLGDFCDLTSLSSYDRGLASAENKRYQYDLEAAHKAMELLMTPILAVPDYKPRLVLTLGNHEDRINRYTNQNPAMVEHLSISSLGYEAWGWEVIPFLKPIEIQGVSYCHYFYHPNTGKPYGGTNLETRLKTIGTSFTMGHQQGLLTAIRDLPNGKRQRGLVAGSFYQHKEDYKGYQGNSHWQGTIVKYRVQDGNYSILELEMDYLRDKYA